MNIERVVRFFYPDEENVDMLERLRLQGEDTMGKNQDYRQGFQIGAWLAHEGEDIDGFSGIDALGDELLVEMSWPDLPVNDAEAFKDGLANGYVHGSQVNDSEED